MTTMHSRSPAGFTLLEVTIVVVILGLLAGIVVPSVIGVLEREQVRVTGVQLATIAKALDAFRVDNGRLPTEDEGLAILWTDPDNPEEMPNWRKYVDQPLAKDPWGNAYVYTPGEPDENGIVKEFTLRSFGPNRQDDNGEPDDIIWPKPEAEEGVAGG
jgi:general secretion pathway protein G